MKKTKKVVYQVQCANNPDHVFEKVYEVIEGTENKTTDVDVYCPDCDAFVTVTIQGKVKPDRTILKKFGI